MACLEESTPTESNLLVVCGKHGSTPQSYLAFKAQVSTPNVRVYERGYDILTPLGTRR